MKLLRAIGLILALAPALAMSQSKQKKPYKLPAVFNQAQYVYVEAVDGQEFDPRLNPDDRDAIVAVNKALYDWNRYVLTTSRDEAQLIFVVRKGRLGSAGVGVSGGAGRQTTPGRPGGQPGQGIGVGVGGEVGSPDDLLEIFLANPQDSQGTDLWFHTMAGGLDGPKLALFQQFKDAVEQAYPKQVANKTPKP